MLSVIDDYSGSLIVRCAFKLLPMVMLRASELAGAEWQEIDLEARTWTIPMARMKVKKALKVDNASSHIVPLSNQAVEVFREIHPLTGRF